MLRAIDAHLGSRQVSRVVYGAIIGLALIVALEEHPPSSGVVVATLLGTAVAVGLAEIYRDILRTETSTRRQVRGADLPDMVYDGPPSLSGSPSRSSSSASPPPMRSRRHAFTIAK